MHNYKNEKYENIKTYKLQSAQPVQIGWGWPLVEGGAKNCLTPDQPSRTVNQASCSSKSYFLWKRHKYNVAWGWGWVKMSPNLRPSWDAAWRNGVSLRLVPFKATPWIACTIYKSILVLALKCFASFKGEADSLSARLLKLCQFSFQAIIMRYHVMKVEINFVQKSDFLFMSDFQWIPMNASQKRNVCIWGNQACKAQKWLPGVNLF